MSFPRGTSGFKVLAVIKTDCGLPVVLALRKMSLCSLVRLVNSCCDGVGETIGGDADYSFTILFREPRDENKDEIEKCLFAGTEGAGGTAEIDGRLF